MTPAELLQELEALQSLSHHPGWRIVSDQLKKKTAQELSLMQSATSQEVLLKHTYTYMAFADLPNLPAVLAGVLANQLQSRKK